MLLGYVLVYLIIGAALALRLPYLRRRTAAKARQLPADRWAMMTPRERAIVSSLIEVGQKPFPTWHLVVTGLVWPTQIVAYLVASIWGVIYQRRVERGIYPRGHEHVLPVLPCPGCGNDLIRLAQSGQADAIEQRDLCQVRFACGHCDAISEWNSGEDPPSLVKTVRGAQKPLGLHVVPRDARD